MIHTADPLTWAVLVVILFTVVAVFVIGDTIRNTTRKD